MHDELIRDRIGVGIHDKNLSDRLQLETYLTLLKAINTVRQKEVVKRQQTLVNFKPFSVPQSVDVVKSAKQRDPSRGKGTNTESKCSKIVKHQCKQAGTKCERCSGPSHQKQVCPAYNSKCHSCGKVGHWARACKSKKVHQVSGETSPISYEDEQFLGEIQLDAVEDHHASTVWKAEVCVNGKQVQFNLDSGADVSVIPFSLLEKFDRNTCPNLERSSKTLLSPCNYKITCKGKFQAKLSIDNKNLYEDIYIVERLERPLLSRHASSLLNLIKKVNEISSKNKLSDSVAQNAKMQILNKYPKLFEGLGEVNGEYNSLIKSNAEPYALNVPRKVPLPLLDKTKKSERDPRKQYLIIFHKYCFLSKKRTLLCYSKVVYSIRSFP